MNNKNNKILSSDEDLEFLASLRKDFFIEGKDRLLEAEVALLDFESTQNELKLLDYKRILHSVKGSAKAVEEIDYATLVHKIEDRIQGSVDEQFFDLNLKFIDISKQYFEASLKEEDVSGLINALLEEVKN